MQQKKGITLVEIVVAAAILALAFIPVVNLISRSATSTVKVGNYAKASDLLAKLMEELTYHPMGLYEEKLPKLLDGSEVQIGEEFYSQTVKNLQELAKDDKEFWVEAKAKAETNKHKQIVELGIYAQISWNERGQKTATGEPERSLRDYSLIFNSEARLDKE